jgi:hypothetical protein
MRNLTSSTHNRDTVITSAEDEYQIIFPTPGITHVIEFCDPATPTGDWSTARITIGHIAIASMAKNEKGEFSHIANGAFVPDLDNSGETLVIAKNCRVPVVSPRTGVLMIKAASVAGGQSIFLSCYPQNESRPEHTVYLPVG